MTSKTTHGIPEDFDWSLTTFQGARGEQLRRWSKLPLEDIIRALEEMDDLAQLFSRARKIHKDPGSRA